MKLTAQAAEQLRKLASQGATNSEIAEQFGIHPRTAGQIRTGRRWKRLNGAPILRDRARGEVNGGSKLSTEQVLAIRDAANYRGSGRDLAARFGISTGNIRHIRIGRTWKHLFKATGKRHDHRYRDQGQDEGKS